MLFLSLPLLLGRWEEGDLSHMLSYLELFTRRKHVKQCKFPEPWQTLLIMYFIKHSPGTKHRLCRGKLFSLKYAIIVPLRSLIFLTHFETCFYYYFHVKHFKNKNHMQVFISGLVLGFLFMAEKAWNRQLLCVCLGIEWQLSPCYLA